MLDLDELFDLESYPLFAREAGVLEASDDGAEDAGRVKRREWRKHDDRR